jgi:hypothetical protein
MESNVRIMVFCDVTLFSKELLEVLTVENSKIMVSWDVIPCSLVDGYRHVRGISSTL